MNKLGFGCLVGAAFVLAGCAGGASTLPGRNANSASVQSAIAIQYATDEAKRQVLEVGLTQPLSKYWNAYVARDWTGRYGMEEFQRPVEKDFYVSYHAAAWTLLELRVDTVDVSDAPNRVKIGLKARFRSLERPDEVRSVDLQDLWTKGDGGWLHLNSDPMLNGLRSVQ